MRDGFYAAFDGDEYEASPDGRMVRLYRATPADGFTEVRPGRHVRVVPAREVDSLFYLRTTCVWRGEPFLVLAEHESWLRVEYAGGRAPVARALGLEEFEYGVYQGWAPKKEVSRVREVRV